MRKGIDSDHLTYLDAGRIAEDAGVAAVALHARTAAEFYSGQADWSAIAALKQAVTSVPVLGNGDIWSAEDAVRMMDETGCDGVVVGRGCLGRPWLFGDLARALGAPGAAPVAPVDATLGFVAQAFRRHAELLVEFLDDEDREAAATSASTSPGTSRATRSAATPVRPWRPSPASTRSTSCWRHSISTRRTRAPRPRASADARARRSARHCPTAG